MLRSLSPASVILLACACSSADLTSYEDVSPASDSDEPAGESLAAPANAAAMEEVLNTLQFEDLELSFIWIGDVSSAEGSLAINETFSVDYVGALREQYGRLTSLELFHAFAPEGAEPHPLLAAQHEHEARAYGRSGEGLAMLDVDARTLSIDKSIPANCQSQILPNISPGSYTEIVSTDAGVDGRYVYTCAGSPKVSGITDAQVSALGCERHIRDKELTVGLCNDSASIQSTEFYTSIFDIVHGPSTTFRSNVSPNGIGRFTLPPTTVIGGARDLAVRGRNSASNVINFHRQFTGVGVYP